MHIKDSVQLTVNKGTNQMLKPVQRDIYIRIKLPDTSLVVQWLRLCASTEDGTGSMLGQGTEIPHVAWHGQKKTKKRIDIEKQLEGDS